MADSMQSVLFRGNGRRDRFRSGEYRSCAGGDQGTKRGGRRTDGPFLSFGKVLLFDEPTSGLDYDHMNKVGDLLTQLAAEGRTVLVSTHDPELIERCCDHELYIRNGRVQFFERRNRTS